eukprot:2434173-Pyramimonas_sp.AAC.1
MAARNVRRSRRSTFKTLQDNPAVLRCDCTVWVLQVPRQGADGLPAGAGPRPAPAGPDCTVTVL